MYNFLEAVMRVKYVTFLNYVVFLCCVVLINILHINPRKGYVTLLKDLSGACHV